MDPHITPPIEITAPRLPISKAKNGQGPQFSTLLPLTVPTFKPVSSRYSPVPKIDLSPDSTPPAGPQKLSPEVLPPSLIRVLFSHVYVGTADCRCHSIASNFNLLDDLLLNDLEYSGRQGGSKLCWCTRMQGGRNSAVHICTCPILQLRASILHF